jgi:hypothetical protein
MLEKEVNGVRYREVETVCYKPNCNGQLVPQALLLGSDDSEILTGYCSKCKTPLDWMLMGITIKQLRPAPPLMKQVAAPGVPAEEYVYEGDEKFMKGVGMRIPGDEDKETNT